MEFESLATDPRTGVVMRDGVYGFPTADPAAWTADVPGVRPATGDLPAGCASAVYARLPMIEMNRYMPWLTDRATKLGISIRQREVHGVDEVTASADVVVNATGLGARTLVGDDGVRPVRGRVVLVEQIGLTEFVDIETDGWPLGIFPRRDDIVLTGTYEIGEDRLDVPSGFDDRIVQRCVEVDPRLAGARRLGAKSGLRPARGAVRLELDAAADGTPIVHNYGHGGGGITLSWGCADEVVRLVEATR